MNPDTYKKELKEARAAKEIKKYCLELKDHHDEIVQNKEDMKKKKL